MTFLLENLWFWCAAAFIAAAIGYMFYQNKPNVKTLGIAAVVPLLILALGFSLYYGIDTDGKSIRRMLDGLAAAIVSGNVEDVLDNYVSPKAEQTRALARANMLLVSVTSAKYRDLKFEVNSLTSPPTARVQFTAFIYWMSKGSIGGFNVDKPVPEIVKFDIEMEKTDSNSWKITNRCDFNPRAMP